MAKMINTDTLNHLVNKMVDNKSIFSAVMKVENSEGSISWEGAAGNMQVDSRYFIASVTKLYVTAIVMKLIEENKITLNDKISKYLPDNYCDRLHVLKGVDYSKELTIYHLITNTSGIPDYFFYKQGNGRTVADELMEGNDEQWPIDRTIELIKKLKPNFKPGAKRKASYSDSNYQEKDLIVPREFAERCYNIQHWTDMPSGGHFAALEEPELLVKDIRKFAQPLK